jgi:serine/threonine protein kinase
LKRDVALKVLPEAFARDPERLARFEREAEVLASLNHPNIAAIYGVVEDRALVMELVEGAEPKGPLRLAENTRIRTRVTEWLTECSSVTVKRLVLDRSRALNRLDQAIDRSLKEGNYRRRSRASSRSARSSGCSSTAQTT